MNRSFSIATTRGRVIALLVACGLSTVVSHPAYALSGGNNGREISYICSCVTSRGGGGAISTFFSDPASASGFQLDLQWDPLVLQFDSLSFVSPYVQSTPPDLTNVSSGILRDIAGVSSIFPPPLGDVDIYLVNFIELNPSAATGLRQFASSNDFIDSYDPSTGNTTRVGPDNIQGCPEPAALLLLISGSLGLIPICRRGTRTC
jgi:hypothetical protein